jgi:hypothetical protein
MSRRFFLIIANLLLAIFFIFAINNRSEDLIVNPSIAEHYPISRIRVIQGHDFDITLKNGNRIRANLRYATAPEAQQEVVEFFNSSLNPNVVLYEKLDHIWIVDIKAVHSGKEMGLLGWLRAKNLVWD